MKIIFLYKSKIKFMLMMLYFFCFSSVIAYAGNRALYVSLKTESIGKIVLDKQAIYSNILDDKNKQNLLINYLVSNKFNTISMYDLDKILSSKEDTDKLNIFIDLARANGIVNIEAIGALSKSSWDKINYFHNNSRKFNALLTEIEFWNKEVNFDDYIGTLNYIKSLKWKKVNNRTPELVSYLGWFTAEQSDAFVPLLDRVNLHCYVKSGDLAYSYCDERMKVIALSSIKFNKVTKIRPIFSAESNMYSAGSEVFMGDWLKENSIYLAENMFLSKFKKQFFYKNNLQMNGFQYYEYLFLSM